MAVVLPFPRCVCVSVCLCACVRVYVLFGCCLVVYYAFSGHNWKIYIPPSLDTPSDAAARCSSLNEGGLEYTLPTEGTMVVTGCSYLNLERATVLWYTLLIVLDMSCVSCVFALRSKWRRLLRDGRKISTVMRTRLTESREGMKKPPFFQRVSESDRHAMCAHNHACAVCWDVHAGKYPPGATGYKKIAGWRHQLPNRLAQDQRYAKAIYRT